MRNWWQPKTAVCMSWPVLGAQGQQGKVFGSPARCFHPATWTKKCLFVFYWERTSKWEQRTPSIRKAESCTGTGHISFLVRQL